MKHSIFIARGRVLRSEKNNGKLGNFVIENARTASCVKLFSMERVGMKVAEKDNEIVVEKVLAGSKSEKSGFKQGDIIRIVKKTTDLISDLERLVRHAYVRESDLEMTVVRDGRQQKLVLSLKDN